MNIIHQPERNRFAVLFEDAEDAELEYKLVQGNMAILHTFVPPDYEGRGIAGRLAVAALEYARAEGLKVQPYCPYVAVYAERHKEYGDLIIPAE